MKFVIFFGYAIQKWKWHLVASNGVILARSDHGFASIAGARRAIWRLNSSFIFAGRPIKVEVSYE